jgi:hypothetical protein
LFSCPTVTVAMGAPSGGGDRPPPQAADQEPGGLACMLVLIPTVAYRAGPSNPWKPLARCLVRGGAAQRRAPLRPRRRGGARSQDSGNLTSVATVHPSTGRTSAGWSPVPRAPGPTRRPGHGPGSVGARVTSAEHDRGGQDPKLPVITGRGYVGDRHIIGQWATAMNTAMQAMENMEYVRRLLEGKQA